VTRLRLLLFVALVILGSAHAADRPLARFLLSSSPPAEAAPLLERVLREAADADPIDRDDDERLLRRLRADTLSVLATEGFFAPKIAIGPDESGEVRYVVNLDLGPRARVSEVTIEFTGEIAASKERMEELRAIWAMPVGRPFRDAGWATAKTRLLNRVRARDFAAARLADSVALTNINDATVRLRVEIDSGPAYTVGEIEVRGLRRYESHLVQRYNPFTVGEPYDADKLLEFQRRLQRAPYFSTVVVDADPERAGQQRQLPILVELKEAQTKRVSFGLGYSTDFRAKAEVSYRQTLLFGHPYTLQSGIGIDSKRSLGYADIYLPPKPDGEQDSLGALFEHTDIEGVTTRRWATGVQRTATVESGPVTYDTRLALNFQHETRDVSGRPEESTTNDVVSATYAWTRRDVDSITMPTRGSILTLSGTVGVGRSGFTEVLNRSFLRGYGRYVVYLPMTPRDQLILRAEAGHVIVDDPRFVPNEFLFRTGGVGTVRGYAFQSLGRKVGTATTGSKTVQVASAEYVRWIDKDWGAAVFYDIGDAGDDLGNVRLAQGYGVGARWRTLAGPLALDLAWGERTGKLRVHFSIAIAF
jgi:translocation and assembly module TamA